MGWKTIKSSIHTTPSVSCAHAGKFTISTRAAELLPSVSSWKYACLWIDTESREIAIARAKDNELFRVKLTPLARMFVFSSVSTGKITGHGRWKAEVRKVKGSNCLVFCYKEST